MTANSKPSELPLSWPRPGKSDAVMVNCGANPARYTSRPSAATAPLRYAGSLLGPSAPGPLSGTLLNCWVGAAN